MKIAAFHYTAFGKNQVAAAPTTEEAYTVIDRIALQFHEVAEIDSSEFDAWREARLNPCLDLVQLTYRDLGFANDHIFIPPAGDWKRVYCGNVLEIWASNSRKELYRSITMKINWNKKVAPVLVALQAKVQLIGVRYPSGDVVAQGRTARQRRQWIKYQIVKDRATLIKTSKGYFTIALTGDGQVEVAYSEELEKYLKP